MLGVRSGKRTFLNFFDQLVASSALACRSVEVAVAQKRRAASTLDWRMTRSLRFEFPGALYHVTAWGDRRQAIYRDHGDRFAWLRLLEKTCARFKFTIHGFCQMTNRHGWRRIGCSRVLDPISPARAVRMRLRLERRGLFSPLRDVKNLVLLGDDAFVARCLSKTKPAPLNNIVRIQRRSVTPSLDEYARRYDCSNEAMARAYQSMAYSMQEIASYFRTSIKTMGLAVMQFDILSSK